MMNAATRKVREMTEAEEFLLDETVSLDEKRDYLENLAFEGNERAEKILGLLDREDVIGEGEEVDFALLLEDGDEIPTEEKLQNFRLLHRKEMIEVLEAEGFWED